MGLGWDVNWGLGLPLRYRVGFGLEHRVDFSKSLQKVGKMLLNIL